MTYEDELVMINGILQNLMAGDINFEQAVDSIIPLTDRAMQAKAAQAKARRESREAQGHEGPS